MKTNFSNEHIISIPVVNKNKLLILYLANTEKNKKNTIFLMAGGKGTRLCH